MRDEEEMKDAWKMRDEEEMKDAWKMRDEEDGGTCRP
jgi:hypothetical protein